MLSFEELTEIVRTAVSLGVSKVRLTGGEPLVRRGIVDLCRSLRAINGVRELTMTTNGALLPQYAAELKQAGVDRLNISLDTLNEDKFASLTRGGSLADTLAGLDAARHAGFRGTKLNAVLLGGVNEDEIPALAQLAQDREFEVRFIELMPIGECADWLRERFLSADAVLHALPELQRLPNEGVAELYRMPGWKGKIGLIRPMSHRFCAKRLIWRCQLPACASPMMPWFSFTVIRSTGCFFVPLCSLIQTAVTFAIVPPILNFPLFIPRFGSCLSGFHSAARIAYGG